MISPRLKGWGEMKDAAADVLCQLMMTRNPIADGSVPKNQTGRSKAKGSKIGKGDFRGEVARR